MLVILNLLIAAEALLTLLSMIYIKRNESYPVFWVGVLVCTVTLAELVLHEKLEQLAKNMIIYGIALVLIPAWVMVRGSIAIGAILYIFVILLSLNLVATKLQRYIINPCLFVFLVAVMSYEYYKNKFIAIVPVEEEIALYYSLVVPLAFILVMWMVVVMIDKHKSDHKSLVLKNEELRRMMRIDTLTGLYNKQFLNEQIKSYMSMSRRSEVPLSVIVIDIDYFKYYNDHYGHIQGDRCLVRVAEIINYSVMRDSDSVFRFGGEEFVVLLYNVKAMDALMVGQRIVDNIRDAKIKHNGSHIDDYVTVSAGLFTFDGKKEMTTNSVIRMADEALYIAKNEGRNRICTLNLG